MDLANFRFRVTKKDTNLFNVSNHHLLEKWSDRFRFCTCKRKNGDAITQEIICNEDFQQSCLETNDDFEASCELAKRKRKREVDRHTSLATRKSLQRIEQVKTIAFC